MTKQRMTKDNRIFGAVHSACAEPKFHFEATAYSDRITY